MEVIEHSFVFSELSGVCIVVDRCLESTVAGNVLKDIKSHGKKNFTSVLVVNDSSLNGINYKIDFSLKTSNFILIKSSHSVKHVVVCSIRVHNSLSESNSDIVLLLLKEINLVIKWSTNFSSVLLSNFDKSL